MPHKKFNPKNVKTLLEKAASKAGVTLEYGDLQILADKISESSSMEITQKYLNETKRKTNKYLAEEKRIGLSGLKLNQITSYLGFESYYLFEQHLKSPVSDQLLSLRGDWVSIVRFNSQTAGYLLISPVRIYSEKNKVKMLLRGPSSDFSCALEIIHDNLFCLIKNPEKKQIHIVFKIGKRKSPNVLKGVFSGISTAGDPIGGRELLIKMDRDKVQEKNHKIAIEEAVNSDQQWLKKAAEYLSDFDNNNLQIGQVNSFGLDDL